MRSKSAPPRIPNYELLRSIGSGSFGEVWLARNALGAFRAVKVVHRAAFADAADYERELTGVRSFEPISREHPGLVDLLDVGVNEAEGYFYYAMELADDAAGEAGSPASDVRSPKTNAANGEPIPQTHSSATHSPNRQSAIGDWQSYSPLTLSARLRTERRLPLAECLRVGVALTDALEFLHGHGLIHRDIKPSNIIFVGGVPKLADVGTVTRVDEAKTMMAGTEGFRAPEGSGKPQADLYSLGKVLYEISTGKDRQRFPEPLTKLADLTDLPKWQEFSAVVDKACQPEPTRRYPSTTELRADLLTIQAGRSVRRQWVLEKRFKQAAWAAAASVLLAASVLYIQHMRSQVAGEKAKAATSRAEEAEKGLALLELEKAIRPPHREGWSSTAWQLASNAAAKFGFDTNLQSQAAASLAGLDAKLLFQTNGIGGSSVAFSPDGKRVLYGALTNRTDDPGKAHVLDLDTKRLTPFPVPGEGPVAFLPDGTPVQFSADDTNRLALWKVGQRFPPDPSFANSTSRPLPAPTEGSRDGLPYLEAAALRCFTLPSGATIGDISALALTPDGAFVAASGTNTAGQSFLAAWDGTTGRLLLPVAASRQSAANFPPEEQRRSPEPPLRNLPATALAFTPDGSLLAAGNDSGEVTVWRVTGRLLSRPAGTLSSIPNGGEGRGEEVPVRSNAPPAPSPFPPISADRLPIRSLAFCRDFVRDPLHPAPEPQWLLAIGDSGGGVSIWEVPSGKFRVRCLGAEYDVFALAFSPDGTLLASAGRMPLKLWDTATGRELLAVTTGDCFHGVGFSPDGQRFAISSTPGVTIPAQLSTWRLENGRGICTLRGLSTPVTRICCTSNGNLVAAVSHNWQVGVWDVAGNRLLHIFNVPRGTFTADNAGLAFSHDGSQFAFMTGTNAVLLATPSGILITNWLLPPGLVDELAFTPANHLLAFRVEPTNSEAVVFTKPGVPRIRDLTARPVYDVLMTLPEYDGGVSKAAWSPDAAFIAVDGLISTAMPTNRVIELVAPQRTAVLWTNSVRVQAGARSFFLDAAGFLLETWLDQSRPQEVMEAISLKRRYSLRSGSIALNSTVNLCLRQPNDGWSLHSPTNGLTLLHVSSTGSKPTNWPDFSRDGRFVVLGGTDGIVSLCDIEESRCLLGTLRLGW